jgi:hypothetical protein
MRLTRRLLLLVLLAASAAPASAQIGIPTLGGGAVDSLIQRFNPVSQLAAGLGFATINGGEAEGQYLMLQLRPEFDLAAVGAPQLGIGIDAPLRFQLGGGDSTASALRFRSEDYDDANERLAILRYVRYGQKASGQAFYARFGALDFARVGYGSLVESYQNEIGEGARQRGGAVDLDFGGVGVETLYGTFSEAGVYAGRAFLRPLRLMGGEAGGWNDLTVGVTLAGDLNPESGFVSADSLGQPFFLATDAEGNPTAEGLATTADRGRLRAVGVDVGMRLASNPLFNAGVYANANRLSDGAMNATGGGLGVLFSFTPPAGTASRLDIRVEAVLNNAGYQPSPFNAFYEFDRLIAVDSVQVTDPETGAMSFRQRYQSRRNQMAAAPRQGGLIGQLSGVLGGVLLLDGRYQQLFDESATGWLHLGADLLIPGGRAFARAGLDRWNIGGNALTNTDPEGRNFQLQAEAGVYLMPTLMIGGIAQRAFSPVYLGNEVVDYRKQDRLEPVVRFVMPF